MVVLPQNVGLGNALNEGLKHCSHELVARMDSDDICLPNRFELQIKIFEAAPNLTIIGGWISEFEDNPNNIISYRKLPETNDQLQQFFKSKNPLNHMSVMFKKSKVVEAGGYLHFYLLEDYWLWARMIKNYYCPVKLFKGQKTGLITQGSQPFRFNFVVTTLTIQKR